MRPPNPTVESNLQVAMSIRATNVYELGVASALCDLDYRYEERSLGVFKPSLADEQEPALDSSDRELVGKYLAWHLKRQLAFGKLSVRTQSY